MNAVGLAKGQHIELQLTDLAAGGEAIGRSDGFVVFVEGGVPGDRADIRLVEVKKSYARGRIVTLLEPSPLRAEPPCPIYAECGGCQLQHIDYEAQLDAKTRFVRDALRNIAGLPDVPVNCCIAAGPPWGYRNKMQLVAARGGRLGLYRRHTHDVVPMQECLIAHPLTNKVLQAATSLLARFGWPPWDEKSGKGLLRHVLARVASVDAPSASNALDRAIADATAAPPSRAKSEALVVLVASGPQVPKIEKFARQLVELVPEVVGVMLNVNPERTNVILGRRTVHVWGRDHLVETVRGVKFRIGATSFFQINTPGLALLSELAEKYLAPRPDDVLVDGYCGVGALSLPMARRVKQIVGIEEIAQAVENARHNALLNGIPNASFVRATVEEPLKEIQRVDAVLVDPPRKGCAPAVLDTIADRGIERLVYVSCNPATLARDLALLGARGYRVAAVQPVDMFPQTSHVECVTLVEKGEPQRADDTAPRPERTSPPDEDSPAEEVEDTGNDGRT